MKKTTKILMTIILISCLVFTSCGANMDYPSLDNSQGGYGSASPDEPNIESTTTVDRKIITTAHYSLETLTFDETLNSIKSAVASAGGYISESRINPRGNGNYGRAYLTIRIPSAITTSFSTTLEGIARVTSSTISTDDVTLTYSDLTARVTVLQAESDALLDMIANTTDTYTLLEILNQYYKVQADLKSYQNQLDTLNNLVAESTFYVNLYDVEKYTEEGKTPTYLQNVGSKFGDSFHVFFVVLENISYGIIYLIPYALVAGAILGTILVVHKFRKKAKTKKEAEKQNEETQTPKQD